MNSNPVYASRLPSISISLDLHRLRQRSWYLLTRHKFRCSLVEDLFLRIPILAEAEAEAEAGDRAEAEADMGLCDESFVELYE